MHHLGYINVVQWKTPSENACVLRITYISQWKTYSAKVYSHRILNLRILKKIGDNVMQHQQGPTHIIPSMCALFLWNLHRPMSVSIIQGLHRSVVACAQQLGVINIKKWQAASAKHSVLKENDVCKCQAVSSRVYFFVDYRFSFSLCRH